MNTPLGSFLFIGKDDDTVINLATPGENKAKYSIEYLKKIIKGGKLTGKVKLQFGNDYPLRVDYLVQDKLNFSMSQEYKDFYNWYV